jgi:hypothetical protein
MGIFPPYESRVDDLASLARWLERGDGRMLSAGKLARHWLDYPTSSFSWSVSQCCSNASRCRLYGLHAPQMYLSKVPTDSYQYSMRSISQLSNTESGRRSPGHRHGQIDGHIIGDLSQPIARHRRQHSTRCGSHESMNILERLFVCSLGSYPLITELSHRSIQLGNRPPGDY